MRNRSSGSLEPGLKKTSLIRRALSNRDSGKAPTDAPDSSVLHAQGVRLVSTRSRRSFAKNLSYTPS